MERFLLDTNLHLRALNPASEHGAETLRAIKAITARADVFCVTPQVIREFWSVATRPSEVNGLGWDAVSVSRYVDVMLDQFMLLDDMPGVFDLWLDIVRAHSVSGKQVHDARLVAVMRAHKVDKLLTFNVDDFKAYNGISVIHPADVE